MEPMLHELLHSEGSTSETIQVLADEEILSLDVFASLKEDHFRLLLPKLKVGQHALVLRIHNQHMKKLTDVSLANSCNATCALAM